MIRIGTLYNSILSTIKITHGVFLICDDNRVAITKYLSCIGYLPNSKPRAVICPILMTLYMSNTKKHVYKSWSHTNILWSIWTLPVKIVRYLSALFLRFLLLFGMHHPSLSYAPTRIEHGPLFTRSQKQTIRTTSAALEWRWIVQISIYGRECISWMVAVFKLIRLWRLRLSPIRWRHNGHDGVSNHQPYDCLFNRLFRRRLKKTSKLRVTGLCVGNSLVPGEFPAQMASNAENVSIWWRHHAM